MKSLCAHSGMKGQVGGFQNPGVWLQAFPSFHSPPPLSSFWLSHHFSRGQNTENPVSLLSLFPNPTETLATQAKCNFPNAIFVLIVESLSNQYFLLFWTAAGGCFPIFSTSRAILVLLLCRALLVVIIWFWSVNNTHLGHLVRSVSCRANNKSFLKRSICLFRFNSFKLKQCENKLSSNERHPSYYNKRLFWWFFIDIPHTCITKQNEYTEKQIAVSRISPI